MEKKDCIVSLDRQLKGIFADSVSIKSDDSDRDWYENLQREMEGETFLHLVAQNADQCYDSIDSLIFKLQTLPKSVQAITIGMEDNVLAFAHLFLFSFEEKITKLDRGRYHPMMRFYIHDVYGLSVSDGFVNTVLAAKQYRTNVLREGQDG